MPLLPINAAAVLFLLVAVPVIAQQVRQDTIQQQIQRDRQMFDGLVTSNDEEKAEVAKRRAAAEAAHELFNKVNAFAEEFNKLGVKFAKGIWDVKQARVVAKAWNKLHDDPGWIEKDKEK